MTTRINPPSHLSDDAKKHFRKTVKLLLDLGVYHHADDDTIEQMSVLVVRSREMDAGMNLAEDPIKVMNALNSMAGQISRISNKLGLDYKSRKAIASSASGRGRPAKNTGGAAKKEDSAEWGCLGVINGGKK